MNFLDERVPESIWRRLTPCPMSGCWLWDRPHRLKFKVNIDGKQRPAHLVIYEAHLGQRPRIGKGHRLVRSCGVDVCCNPQHLIIDIRSQRVERDLAGQTFGHLTATGRGP